MREPVVLVRGPAAYFRSWRSVYDSGGEVRGLAVGSQSHGASYRVVVVEHLGYCSAQGSEVEVLYSDVAAIKKLLLHTTILCTHRHTFWAAGGIQTPVPEALLRV